MRNHFKCPDCQHSYDGADNTLRCRITGREARMACTSFEREPGADGVESAAHRVWYCDVPGRGD